MPENLNMDDLTEARRKSIAETIKTIDVEELKALCEGLFPSFDHPWRERVFDFIKENASATFHHAVTHDRVHFIYCHTKDKGMWFLPGSGMGPMQPKGLKILKEIVEGK
jgi:uncharacterized Zn-finger protein